MFTTINSKCLPFYYLLFLSFFWTANSLIAQPLSEEDKALLQEKIETIAASDQRYRTPLSVGTLNDSILQVDKEKSKTLSIQEYMAFRQTLDLKLPKEVRDSLWQLQRALDRQNLEAFKEIVAQYGYPSKERLGTKSDRLFTLLLHPPYDKEEIPGFMEEMSAFLLPEVEAGRMPAKLYALFYDNMLGKILRKPQLYGTNQQFDPQTNTVLPPGIIDIEETNRARVSIGLPVLEEGAYRIITPE